MRFLFLPFFIGCIGTSQAQHKSEEDYKKIFGRNYEKAIDFLEKEKWIDSVATSQGLNPIEVKSVIFPELIRYNSIQDRMETFALEMLYAQYGKAYANFSIGAFQVKPSFAESIESDFVKAFGEQEATRLWKIDAGDTLQTEINRSNRIKRMKNKMQMNNYICAFFKLMDRKYTTWTKEEEKIRFYASAYNCGYQKSKEEINGFAKKKFFQIGFGINTKYNYSDIAWYYFSRTVEK